MVMNLNPQKKTYGSAEDHSWLGSRLGTNFADGITLDGPSFAAKFATGLVPSGVPLTRLGTGKYAPAIKGAADGTQVISGYLYTTVDLTHGGDVAANTDSPGALYWVGEVIAAKLPTYTSGYLASDFPVAATLVSNCFVRVV